jgi:hypothetical protein
MVGIPMRQQPASKVQEQRPTDRKQSDRNRERLEGPGMADFGAEPPAARDQLKTFDY